MSRSYKKTPVYQDGYGTKQLQWYKRCANKKVRRTREIASDKAYRKVYETWIFRDYVFRETLSEYKTKLENEIKHYLNFYVNMGGLALWRRKKFNDKHFKCWKKIFYWK
jgi:hypothetical protein